MKKIPTWQLFAVCLLVWSTTWYVITFQVDTVAPELGVALRFCLASAVIFVLCLLRRQPLRFSAAQHRRFALQGVLLYGVSYVCVYRAEGLIVSGLVAVGFSLSPLVAGLGAWWAFGARVAPRFLVGGLLSVLGVVLISWPEITHGLRGTRAMAGVAMTLAAVLLSAGGGLVSSRNTRAGMPLWPSLAWGMLYGGLSALVLALPRLPQFVLPSGALWWLCLAYLSVAGSVLTFACYLTIQERRGPGAAATLGVMTPVLALVISTVFEGYRPDLLAVLGVGLAMAGNSLMLRREDSRAPSAPTQAARSAARQEAGTSRQ